MQGDRILVPGRASAHDSGPPGIISPTNRAAATCSTTAPRRRASALPRWPRSSTRRRSGTSTCSAWPAAGAAGRSARAARRWCWLAARVGPSGRVLATDIDLTWLTPARDRRPARRRGDRGSPPRRRRRGAAHRDLRPRARAPRAGAPSPPRTRAARAGASAAARRRAADRGRRSGAAAACLHRPAQPGRGTRESPAHRLSRVAGRAGRRARLRAPVAASPARGRGSTPLPPTPTSRSRYRNARGSRRRRSATSAASSCATPSPATPTSTHTWARSPPERSISHSRR